MNPLWLIFFLTASAAAAECRISWEPETDAVDYRVWAGLQLIATVTEPRATVDLPADKVSTVTVTARNEAGESGHSEPMSLLPVTPQSSSGLTSWTLHRVFFIKYAERGFFRFSYPTR